MTVTRLKTPEGLGYAFDVHVPNEAAPLRDDLGSRRDCCFPSSRGLVMRRQGASPEERLSVMFYEYSIRVLPVEAIAAASASFLRYAIV